MISIQIYQRSRVNGAFARCGKCNVTSFAKHIFLRSSSTGILGRFGKGVVRHQRLRVPRQDGYDGHPQNLVPAVAPFFDSRSNIGRLHSGQSGGWVGMDCGVSAGCRNWWMNRVNQFSAPFFSNPSTRPRMPQAMAIGTTIVHSPFSTGASGSDMGCW